MPTTTEEHPAMDPTTPCDPATTGPEPIDPTDPTTSTPSAAIGAETQETQEVREVRVARPGGRLLAAAVRGPSDGPVVVLLHSTPGSRVFDPDPAATAAAGIRLITIDRAGYGDSTPLAEGEIPSLAGQADDTRAVLDHLGVRDAAVVGWSGGGRVAIATAARHPELVRSVGLVATPAPDDQVPWVAPEHRVMAEAMRSDPAAAVATITAVFAGAGDPTEDHDLNPDGRAPAAAEPAGDHPDDEGEGDLTTMVTGCGEADTALLADPAVRARVETMLGVGFQAGPAGVATDIVADQVVPWGIDVRAVGAPVTLVYGDADAVVTPEHGRWYADQLVNPDLRVVPGAGHLVVITEWAFILDAVTARR